MPGFFEDKVRFSLSAPGVEESSDNVIELTTYKSYSFYSDFLVPLDAFDFVVGDSDITDQFRKIAVPGAEVSLRINDRQQCRGYVDSVKIMSSRSGGTEYHVAGRNGLKYVADSCIDPRTTFQPTQTLEDILKQVFAPFGFADSDDFDVDNDANKSLITGSTHGTKTSKKGKPLKKYVEHLAKPYPREGAFQFASRLAQRQGLWIWLQADGRKIIVGKPTYSSEDLFELGHTLKTGQSNILHANVTRDDHDMPAAIIASGFGVGGAVPRDQFTRGMLNPLIASADGQIGGPFFGLKKIQESWPKTTFVDYLANEPGASFDDAEKFFNLYARPMFLHDDESKTHEQLENFLRREMALRLRKSFSYHCEVEGHSQDGIPWCNDTMCHVNDEVLGVRERLWIQSRTFTKSRSGGTKTSLQMIRPYTLVY